MQPDPWADADARERILLYSTELHHASFARTLDRNVDAIAAARGGQCPASAACAA